MLEFRTALRDSLMTKIDGWVGPTSSPQLVKYIDKRLHDVEPTQLPYIVVTVRHVQPNSPGEIGNSLSGQKDWLVHIYYLDMDPDWDIGDMRHTLIMGLIAKRLEQDPFLGRIADTDTEGNEEYVYDSEITDIIFDSTGVEGDYSFVSELYLTVRTDRR